MDKIDEAALKALKATNYCTKHGLYHGQKYKSCTPQERVIIKVKPTTLKSELIKIIDDYVNGLHRNTGHVADQILKLTSQHYYGRLERELDKVDPFMNKNLTLSIARRALGVEDK